VSRPDAAAPRAVLIGIGSPYRCDDGIGPALAAAIGRAAPPGVTVTEADGEPSALLDAWSGVPLAVVVDAVLCAAPEPGRIHRTALDLPPGRAVSPAGVAAVLGAGAAAASTHGLGVPDAVRLAQALDRTPGRLVVFAVEAADLGFGSVLSPAVAACLPQLISAVLAELGAAAAGSGP
jgi:hydrogenase maturation protease